VKLVNNSSLRMYLVTELNGMVKSKIPLERPDTEISFQLR